MKKLLFFWSELKSTFWFVPVLIILFAVALSIAAVYLDTVFTIPQRAGFRFFLVNSANSARSILSTISGAMISVTGTVFSITLVALTLASSQLGPRLIKNFMYDRLNQVVLGSYIATYLYCLLVLNAIRESEGQIFIPSLSILLAILAAAINIVLLIIFIHHIAVSIQADKVISDISEFISARVETLFPEKMGEEEEEADPDVDALKEKYAETTPIRSWKSGYLQYVDSKALIHAVTKRDTLFELYYRPGGYLVKGEELGRLYSQEKPEEGDLDWIRFPFVIGQTKTAQQDLEFSIHQMVEIAVRALSPGVNDPYTAISCIDNLTATMVYLAQAKFPEKYRYDEEGELRIIADALDFAGVLDAAFNQIRQFSAGSTAVIIRLMEALITIHKFTKKGGDRQATVKHARMTFMVGKESIQEKNDLQDLADRARQILPDLQAGPPDH